MVADYHRNNRYNGAAPDIMEETEKLFAINNGLNQPQKISYEVVRAFEEIKECLRLRYITFRYVNFIEESMDRLDIDPYDRYSTFLGAYNVTGGRKTLVGTLRIISGDDNHAATQHIERLISSARDPKIRALKKRPQLFPIFESFDVPSSYLDCFNKAKKADSSINPYEISRLAIRPDYWLHGLDIGLHHLLILDSWLHKPPRNDFLIAVHPRSRKRYESIGFKIIHGTGVVLYKHINQLAVAMIIDLEKYLQQPRSYMNTCESLLPDFKKKGSFTRMMKKRTLLKANNNGYD